MLHKKGIVIAGLLITIVVIAGWMNVRVQAMDTRPTIPNGSTPEGTNSSTSGASQIVYELGPEYQIQEARMREAENAKRVNMIGIVSWGCIGAGVLVVVVVLIVGGRKRPGGMGGKRTRYRREIELERSRRYMDDNRYRKY